MKPGEAFGAAREHFVERMDSEWWSGVRFGARGMAALAIVACIAAAVASSLFTLWIQG